jgi:hypothetical protein
VNCGDEVTRNNAGLGQDANAERPYLGSSYSLSRGLVRT